MGARWYCNAPEPKDIINPHEGQHEETYGLQSCKNNWYYFSGWTEELPQKLPAKWCEEKEEYIKNIKFIIADLAIANGEVYFLDKNIKISRTEIAEKRLSSFFTSRIISDDFWDIVKTNYSSIKKEEDLHYSYSGKIDPITPEFDVFLEFTAVGMVTDLVNAYRLNRLVKASSQVTFENGLFRDAQKNIIADLTSGEVKNINFIPTGGKVLGESPEGIKYFNDDVANDVLQLVEKDGKIGFRVVAKELAKTGDEVKYLTGKGFSGFEEIDDVIIFRDANNRIGKVLDKTKLDDITWFTPKAGNTWPIHETNVTDYLKFKYGNKVSTQVKVRTYHKNGTTVDGYLDDLVETSNTDLLIIDAKHSQKAQIVDGKIPGYTTGQTQTYQWITDGNAVKIEIIGDRAARNGLPRGTDILPRLKGKVGIVTNDANGQMVELSVYKTTK